MTKKIRFDLLFALCVVSILAVPRAFAQGEAAKIQRSQTEIQQEERMRTRIEKKRPQPAIEEAQKEAPPSGMPEEKIEVTRINVVGTNLVPRDELDKIVRPYQGKTLTMRDMQKVADLITDAYRQRGYVTSRAYLPPQKIQQGTLEIRVVEGTTGNIEVRGNRWFSTKLIKGKICLEEGEPFDYNKLKRGMVKINQKPDRNAKATLTPGREPGQTDVVLDVTDRIPLHAGFDYDNFGSRYIGHNRYAFNGSDTNLLGLDDTLAAQYMFAADDRFNMISGTYQIPFLCDTLKLGLFGAYSNIKLGKEFERLDLTGTGYFWSIFVSQTLLDTDRATLNLTGGFDYKDVFNEQLGEETSRDRLRILKWGLDLDMNDDLFWGGRTIITNEMDFGIPEFLSGQKEVDPRSSRVGAGGGFVKDVINALRVQYLPYDATLLWKNQFQFASDILAATEQYQIGGIANVRGYPPAEFVGDSGLAMTWELALPPYFIPKTVEIPYAKTSLYDTIRFVGFYDLGWVSLRAPQVGEPREKTLSSLGLGVRFNLPQYAAVRLEFAWPLTKSSDGHNVQTLLGVSVRY